MRDISSRGLASLGLADKPLQLAIHSASERIDTAAFSYRVFPNSLPDNAFLKINDDIAIASPEHCFAEFARMLAVPELIVLAFENGSSYSYVPTGQFGFTSKQPVLCNVASMRRYLDKLPRTAGVRRAREALRWVKDDSASPRETELGLRLYLPKRLGGYGLDGLDFNGAVRINKISAERIGVKSFHCDLLYRRENVGLEYQSASCHLDRQAYAHDMQRMNAIQAAGTRIINVADAHLASYQQFDLLARDLTRALGRKYRTASPDQVTKKMNLASALKRAERLVKALDRIEDGTWTMEDSLGLRAKVLGSEKNWLDGYMAIPELYLGPEKD